MLRRRRPLNAWSPAQLLDHVEVCFCSPPEAADIDVRAVVVLRQDEALLPKNTVALARAEAEEAGEPFDGLPPYLAFCMALSDEARVEVFMGGAISAVMEEVAGASSVKEAAAHALRWIGTDASLSRFEHIPGLYQAGFFEFITGAEFEMGAALFAWMLPAEGDYVPMRRFPGPVSDSAE